MTTVRTVLTAFFVGLVLACSSSYAADSEAAALRMVRSLRLGDNLSMLGLQTAARTTTFQIISKSVGPDKARTLVSDELNTAKPKYQEQWDKNLAASYAPLFSAEELRSIAEKQRQSPYFSKFMSKQNEVGNAMQAKSSGLLKEYVTEALTTAFRKVAPAK